MAERAVGGERRLKVSAYYLADALVADAVLGADIAERATAGDGGSGCVDVGWIDP